MERMEAAVCVFELRKRMIGQLFITEVLENSIVVNYTFSARNLQSGEQQELLRTSNVNSNVGPMRVLLDCRECRGRKWSLYYNHVWLCADCHELRCRSQLVDKDLKLWEEADNLGRRVREGRPKGMHNSTYIKLRQRLAVLDRQLEGKPRKYASESRARIVTARWVPGAELDLWSSRYAVERGSFVRRDTWS